MLRYFRFFLLLISLFALIPACSAQARPKHVRDYIYGPGGQLIMTAEGDIYAPTTPLSISAFANGCAGDGVSISWDTSSTDIGSGIGSYYVYKNGGLLYAFNPSVSDYTDYDISGGEHITYAVEAVDNAGNTSDQIHTSVTVPMCWVRWFPLDLFHDGKRVLFAGLRLFDNRKATPASSWGPERSKQPSGSGQGHTSPPAPSNKIQPISFDLKHSVLPSRRNDTALFKLGGSGRTPIPTSSLSRSGSVGGGQ
jgi:hypothetical protein